MTRRAHFPSRPKLNEHGCYDPHTLQDYIDRCLGLGFGTQKIADRLGLPRHKILSLVERPPVPAPARKAKYKLKTTVSFRMSKAEKAHYDKLRHCGLPKRKALVAVLAGE